MGVDEDEYVPPIVVTGDDMCFKPADQNNLTDQSQYKLLDCDLINPPNDIITGATQKLVMTCEAKNN